MIPKFQITTFDMTAHYCACQSSVSSGALVVAAAVYVYILELPYKIDPQKMATFHDDFKVVWMSFQFVETYKNVDIFDDILSRSAVAQ